MFTKKFLESNFTPLNLIISRQKKLQATDTSCVDVKGAEQGAALPDEAMTEEAPSLLSRHKGKLAVGAAAMLGIAAFYHWRESKLAREDEEEYARLQRLKAALDVFESD